MADREELEGLARESRGELDARVDDEPTEATEAAVMAPGKLTLTAIAAGFGPRPARPAAPGKVPAAQPISRKARGGAVEPDALEAVERAAARPGQPLPEALRAELERALGLPLERVRLHADEAAADASRALAARAFARGQDVFFGHGEYDPSSAGGRRLIAHEVAHTVQAPACARAAVSSPGDAHERDADAFADAFAAGGPAPRVAPRSAAPGIHRYSDGELREAAEYRAMLVARISPAEPREARTLLRLLQQARRRGRREHLVTVPYQGVSFRLRFEDVDFLIARARYAADRDRDEARARQRREAGNEQPAEQNEGQDERPPPPSGNDEAMTAQQVEAAIERTRAFGAAMNRVIRQRLRRQRIDVSDRIHYMPQAEFRARYRRHLEQQLADLPHTPELERLIDSRIESTYGYTDPETDQIYLDRESARSTNALHEAVHLLEHEGFITATEDPSAGQPPRHLTPFHEATTSYLTSVIAAESNIPVAADYHPQAITAVRRLAQQVGDDTLLRAYMTGDLRPILSQVRLLDQFLIAYYQGDEERMTAALEGVERRH